MNSLTFCQKIKDQTEVLLMSAVNEPDLWDAAVNDINDNIGEVYLASYADGIKCGIILSVLVGTILYKVAKKNKHSKELES